MVKILKNLEFGKNFRYIFILIKIVANCRFWSKLTKMSTLDKIAENVDYSQNFRKKHRFGSKFANISMLVKIFENFRFWSKFLKISILVKIYESLDFGQYCRKIMILVNILGKSRF